MTSNQPSLSTQYYGKKLDFRTKEKKQNYLSLSFSNNIREVRSYFILCRDFQFAQNPWMAKISLLKRRWKPVQLSLFCFFSK